MKFLTLHEKSTNPSSMRSKLLDWEGGVVVHLQLEKGQKIPPHKTSQRTLVIIHRGHVHFTVEGTTKNLIPGTLLLMEPNEEHALEAVEESSLFIIKMGNEMPKNCLHSND